MCVSHLSVTVMPWLSSTTAILRVDQKSLASPQRSPTPEHQHGAQPDEELDRDNVSPLTVLTKRIFRFRSPSQKRHFRNGIKYVLSNLVSGEIVFPEPESAIGAAVATGTFYVVLARASAVIVAF